MPVSASKLVTLAQLQVQARLKLARRWLLRPTLAQR